MCSGTNRKANTTRRGALIVKESFSGDFEYVRLGLNGTLLCADAEVERTRSDEMKQKTGLSHSEIK